MLVDIQLSPATVSWPALRDGVLLAESRGFHTTWVFDHFDGSMLAGGPSMLECFTLLGALAACTERIGLGTLVVNVANRHPAVIAQCAAAAQAISGGRFVLGLGAGAAPGSRWAAEHDRLRIPLAPTAPGRRQRVAEALDELDRLWSPDRDEDLAGIPVPSPRPPVVMGINSSTALAALAGRRCDGVNVSGSSERIAALVGAADDGRREADRLDAPWDCSVWAFWDDALLDPDHPDRRRWEALGVNRLVLVFLEAFDERAIARAVPNP